MLESSDFTAKDIWNNNLNVCLFGIKSTHNFKVTLGLYKILSYRCRSLFCCKYKQDRYNNSCVQTGHCSASRRFWYSRRDRWRAWHLLPLRLRIFRILNARWGLVDWLKARGFDATRVIVDLIDKCLIFN